MRHSSALSNYPLPSGAFALGAAAGAPDWRRAKPALAILAAGAALVGLLAAVPHPAPEAADRAQLLDQARAGEPSAQLMLALAYRDGRYGLPVDHRAATGWLAHAAEAGDSYAAASLGDAYAAGDGVAADAGAARQWWTRAAEAGDRHAESRLGLALSAPGASAEERFAGLRWLEKASAAGDQDARRALGGDPAAPAEADADATGVWGHLARLFDQLNMDGQRADALLARARSGDSDAQYELALRYRNGAWGVDADPVQAVAWLRQAARHGNPVAMQDLSEAYRSGQLGLAPNPAKAAKWHNLASLEQNAPATL
ncbi:sel1 repeat family protein [Parasulfuritortus cantonensis]|uniref:Sel1 repeat family protein n=1 Tax=Parasulfuritortus cantonensis TaxID=2528202 RepID=A0A4R1B6I1_9PROT|nr:tetratricopeptide repeat protein [Parasulfuritortus cantonensis]TCJ11535.1 sel1 repeat family protein [Parasulfuritortus cantonensis]